MNKSKVLQIGPHSYVGGVSIHIKRLTSILNQDFEFEYIDESPSGLTPADQLNIRRLKDQRSILKALKKHDLIHIHSGNWLLRLYFIIFSALFRKPFIVTLHSYRIKGFKASLTERLLSKTKLIIAVSKEIKGKLPQSLKVKAEIKEAFIPPIIENEDILPLSILKLIQDIKLENKILVSANAFRLTNFNDSELYGLDQCIGVAQLAKKNQLNIHIIFIIGTLRDEDKEYYFSFKDLIKENNLEIFISIIPEKVSFVKLIEESDLVLRPTLSDGDALTIREALFLNKNVLASDVVQRPQGTYLYKTGDIEDLYLKIEEVTSKEASKNPVLKTLSDYKQEYTKIYNQCNN